MWKPGTDTVLAAYVDHVRRTHGLEVASYDDLWQWSVDELDAFWLSVVDFFGVPLAGDPDPVRSGDAIVDCRWFPGARVSYAERMLCRTDLSTPALLAFDEAGTRVELGWDELRGQVGAAARWLREHGVAPGDRVVAYVGNRVEAVVALLACATVGAVWSSCSPEYGVAAAVDRFAQLEPTVLLATASYRFGGKAHDRSALVAELREGLPTVRHVVAVGPDPLPVAGATPWTELVADPCEPDFADVAFEHPLWIVFSSGTTGKPKGIVHGHGGVVLEHLKFLGLHVDIQAGRRFGWYSSTSWIMWNIMVSGLLHGATVVLYDGSPGWPGPDRLWQLAEEAELHTLGTSAAYLASCERAGLTPGRNRDLSHLKAVGSTGSPLAPSTREWLHREVGDLWVANASGGTDVASAFAAGVPGRGPVVGDLEGRSLGVRLEAWDDAGHSVVDEIGEMVVTAPMPSMPLGLWDDPERVRYAETYFSYFPGVWRHGDWLRIEADGSVSVHGRSDATINRLGVRVGSAEVYRALDPLPMLRDSLLVGVERPDGGYWLGLFVVVADGVDAASVPAELSRTIRAEVSPRHVPDEVVLVDQLPRTLTGKRVELPVKRLLQGVAVERAVSLSALDHPDAFTDLARFRDRVRTEDA